MKIIDEKGKLFGLINIIDLIVLLLIVIIVVGGAKRFGNKPVLTTEETPAKITFEVRNVRDITVDQIQVGDPIYFYDRGGYIGTISDKEVKPYTEEVEYEGTWVNAEMPGKYFVYFTIDAQVRDSEDVVVAGGEQVRVGVEMRMKNKKVAFFGTCIGVELEQ